MKNILLILALSVSGLISYGQSATADPALFTGDDEVTITIDATGSTLAGWLGDTYVWTWAVRTPGLPDVGAPTNANPAGPGQVPAKLTRSATNPDIYTITFVPKDFFGIPAVQFTRIGILAKGPDWSNGQTPDFFLDVQPPVFESPVLRVFPSEFSADDVVTIFYDTRLEENEALKDAGEYYLYTTIAGKDANGDDLDPSDYDLPINESTKLISIGNGVYRLSFVPSQFYDLNPGDVITGIRYLVQNISGSLRNPPAGFEILNKTVRVNSN
jgi:hypothetical protein